MLDLRLLIFLIFIVNHEGLLQVIQLILVHIIELVDDFRPDGAFLLPHDVGKLGLCEGSATWTMGCQELLVASD